MGKIYLFTSGKGGVGKTTVCSNLAVRLAKNGYRVLVMDADIWLRNTDIVLGLHNSALLDIQDLYTGACTEEQVIIHHPTVDKLDFIAAPANLTADPKELFFFISKFADDVSDKYDFVFIDCPAGISFYKTGLVTRKHRAIIVSTPDLTSLRDAERTASILSELGAKEIRLIINRVVPSQIKKGLAPDIDRIIDSICVQLIGIIPDDPRVPVYTYVEQFACLHGQSKIREAFFNIALRISGAEAELQKL